jgi:hypothetical protein
VLGFQFPWWVGSLAVLLPTFSSIHMMVITLS